MRHWVFLVLLLLCGNGLSAEPAPSAKGDFLAAPPFPAAKLQRTGKNLKPGLVEISYAGGAITEVVVKRSSGDQKMDQALCQHIRQTYRLRPGTKGKAIQPFAFGAVASQGGDFISTPDFGHLSRQFAGLQRPNLGRFRIMYRDGVITTVEVMKSTGDAVLDQQVVRHIMQNWRVGPGLSGTALLPVTLRL